MPATSARRHAESRGAALAQGAGWAMVFAVRFADFGGLHLFAGFAPITAGVARARLAVGAAALALLAGSVGASAQTVPLRYNGFGLPGLIDMPSARMMPDAEIAASLGTIANHVRLTAAFQVTPWALGAFRYSVRPNGVTVGQTDHDRSIDVRLRFARQDEIGFDAVVGIRDMAGVTKFSSEYVAFTRSTGPAEWTAGMGWGRLGSYGSFRNPLAVLFPSFATRPSGTTGRGGIPEVGRWFHGPAALFGGVSWQIGPRLKGIVEYSSDAYATETANGVFTHRSPLNFALSWQIDPSASATLAWMYGDTIGLGFTATINPERPPAPGSLARAPQPVVPRPSPWVVPAAWSIAWTRQPQAEAVLRDNLAKLFAPEGLRLD
ncbi:MAG: hypothetical protein D6832_02915, partial [Alphaproteobacteria bacterium]